MSKYKEDIISLRKEGKTYGEIKEILDCSKGTISYHCRNENLADIGLHSDELSDEKKKKIKSYYKSHSKKETAEKFDVSQSTVLKYGDRKRKESRTEEDRRKCDRLRTKRLRQKKKKKAVNYLGGECSNCGYDDCLGAFDFHHQDEKKSRLSSLISRCRKWDVIKEELDKCVLLCANCHRELHWKNFQD